MKKIVAAFAIAATALTGTVALAESTVVESQKKLDRAFAADDLSERQVSRTNDNFVTRTFGGINFSFISPDGVSASSEWGNNYRGGRTHEPAGR